MSPQDYIRLLAMPRGELIALVIELINHVLRLQRGAHHDANPS